MILFIVGKYISKLSPSDNVNKNGKIYFLISMRIRSKYTQGKKIVKVCCQIKKSQPLSLYDNK